MWIAMTQTHRSRVSSIVVLIFKVHVSDARLFLDYHMIDLVAHVSLMVIGIWLWCVFDAWEQKVRIDASCRGWVMDWERLYNYILLLDSCICLWFLFHAIILFRALHLEWCRFREKSSWFISLQTYSFEFARHSLAVTPRVFDRSEHLFVNLLRAHSIWWYVLYTLELINMRNGVSDTKFIGNFVKGHLSMHLKTWSHLKSCVDWALKLRKLLIRTILVSSCLLDYVDHIYFAFT